MSQDKIEFEKLALENEMDIESLNPDGSYANIETESAWLWFQDGLRIATTEANKRIAELEGDVELQRSLNKKLYLSFLELQAINHDLREALKRALEDLVPHHTKPSTYKTVNEALSATPAKSLQAHDDELLERAEKAADSARWAGTDVVLAIRALKEVTK